MLLLLLLPLSLGIFNPKQNKVEECGAAGTFQLSGLQICQALCALFPLSSSRATFTGVRIPDPLQNIGQDCKLTSLCHTIDKEKTSSADFRSLMQTSQEGLSKTYSLLCPLMIASESQCMDFRRQSKLQMPCRI